MYIFNIFQLKNIIIVSFYYILLSAKFILCDELIDMKKLSLYNSYFVVLDKGLYLYNIDNNAQILDGALIKEFERKIVYLSDKVILSEINNQRKAFILCMINNDLYIFNERTNKTYNFTISDIKNPKNNFYNIMPYKIESNNLSFIIAYNNATSNLYFYYYSFNKNGEINKINKIKFDNMEIINKKINCQLISNLSFIKCFHYSNIDGESHLSYDKFSINEMNIEKIHTNQYKVGKIIKQVKSAMSFNNNIFVCYSKNSTPVCVINYLNYETKEINCTLNSGYNDNYKVSYINETNEFMLTSKTYLTTTLYNNTSESVTKCGRNILSKQAHNYYIIYYNGFKLLNYSNYEYYSKFHNISIIKEEPTTITYMPEETTYINEILTTNIFLAKTYLIIPEYNSTYVKEVIRKSKEEIFSNISNILEDRKIGVYYEIKGEDFSIVIKPTNSTPLPNTTHVEFDECEQLIRYKYNISNSSIITFVQIEINNDNNDALYNQIKYFIYDEQMKELDLSLCQDIETQIHYAIKNNTNLDISSISNFKDKGIDIFDLRDKFLQIYSIHILIQIMI